MTRPRFCSRVIKIPIQWHVSQSLAPFPTLALEPAASRSCNNGAAEGRAGGEALKACPRPAPAAVMRKRSIRGLSVLHSYHKLLRAASASAPFVVRARESAAPPPSLVEREAVKWDLNHDVAVVVRPRRSFLPCLHFSISRRRGRPFHPPPPSSSSLLSAA